MRESLGEEEVTEGTILVVPKAIGNGRVDLELFMSEVCWVVVTSWKGKRRGLWSGTPGGWQHTEPNGGTWEDKQMWDKVKRLWPTPTVLDVWDVLWRKSSLGT